MKISKIDYGLLNDGPGARQEFARHLVEGFSEIGFVALHNHPITAELQDEFHSACHKVFNMPLDHKSEYEIAGFKGQRGYVGFGRETAVGAPAADLKEFWHIGRSEDPQNPLTAGYLPNIFPQEVPEFQRLGLQLYSELEVVAQTLLESLTDTLDLQADYFREYVASGNSILRALNYPGYFRVEHEGSQAVRAAAHTDINLITLLLGASQKGLQVQTLGGEWVNVNCRPNEMVVNVGDMLQRLSNMRFVSTVHRVLNPCQVNDFDAMDDFVPARISIPFFCHPASSMPLNVLDSCVDFQNPPRFEDITAGDYLNQRLAELGLLDL